MERRRTVEVVLVLMLCVSLALNIAALGRLSALEAFPGRLASLDNQLVTLLNNVSSVNSRLQAMEREAAWITDLRWDVDTDQVSRRGQSVPVAVSWALKEVNTEARVFVSYGSRDGSEWLEAPALSDGTGRFRAEMLLDPTVDWGFLIVADDGQIRRTSDPLALPMAGKFEAPFSALVWDRGSWREIELMRMLPVRFAWQVVQSITATYSLDGEEVEAPFEPLDPSGERDIWTLKVPEEVTEVVLDVLYVDGHLEQAQLYVDGRPIDEPLFGRE